MRKVNAWILGLSVSSMAWGQDKPEPAGPATVGVAAQAAGEKAAPAKTSRQELEQVHISFSKDSLEWSGGTFGDKGKLWLVDDGSDSHFIYEADISGTRFQAEKVYNFADFKGYDAYVKAFEEFKKTHPNDKLWDLEGLSRCADTLYVANERLRDVVVLDLKSKELSRVPIQFSEEQRKLLAEGGSNAGFEGVTVNCAEGILYVAKERDPRRLYAVNLADGKVLDDFDFTPSNRAHQHVINPFTGDGLMDVGSDAADLFFEGGYLYVLERNSYEIAKLNPKTHEVEARVSFFKTAYNLYDTGEPFGLAEVLILTPEAIILGYDNNKTPIGARASEYYGVSGKHGALSYFNRPKGF